MKREVEINLGKLFEKFLEAKEDRENLKIPVGTVSDELRLKFRDWRRKKAELDDELELEQDRLIKEMKRRLLETFEDRTDAMTQKKKDIWDEIYKELNIQKMSDDTFCIDSITGEVTREVEKTKEVDLGLFGKSHGLQ